MSANEKGKAAARVDGRVIVSILILFILLALFAGSAYRLGLFKKVSLEQVERGPYTVVGIAYTGPYRLMRRQLGRMRSELQAREWTSHVVGSCALVLDGLNKVRRADQRHLAAFVAADSLPAAEVTAPFEQDDIPARDVLVARTAAHPALILLKAKPHINRWLRQHTCEADGPLLIRYYDDYIEVEVPLRWLSR